MYPILFRLPEWLPLMGGEPITSFGVMMFLAFLTGGSIMHAELGRLGEDAEVSWDLLFMAVIGGVLGAKLYYVLLNYPLLVENPRALLLSRGGMVWYGGFVLGTAMVVWKIRRIGLPMGKTADAAAPSLALGYAVGRVGCFLVGDDYGRPTDSWVGIAFPEGAPPTRVDILEQQFGVQVDPAIIEKFGDIVPVHPTQLYEVGMSTLIFLVLWRIRGHEHAAGWLFMLWLALAGIERFVVEVFRAKDDRFFGVLTLAQMISVGLVVFGVVGMNRLKTPQAVGASA